MKTTSKERIKLALDRTGKSISDLARFMGKSQPTISERLSGPGDTDSISLIEAASDLTGYSFNWLAQEVGEPVGATLHDIMMAEAPTDTYLAGKSIRPIAITVSHDGKELVSYVPVKAQAGYMRGYDDPHFIEKLPAFSLPGVIKDQATHRMFEVNGDSMLQLGNKGLRSGDIIIARYLEDIFTLRDNRVYVIVTPEGVAVKRVLNRLKDKEAPCLVLMSDNKGGDYPNYLVKPKQVLEVWEAKKVISSDFSFDTNLFEILGDIQAEQAKLKEKVNELTKK